MVRRKVNFLVFITVISSCIKSIHCYYDYQHEPKLDHPTNLDISVMFPKYNIKIAPASVKEGPQLIYEEIPPNFEGYNEVEEQEYEATAPVSENIWNNYYIPHQNQPIYLQEPEEQSSIYYLEPEPQYPIITREPIETKKPCILQYPPVYSYARSTDDSEVRPPKPDGFFSAPWNADMNTFRAADPRSLISSHTHFIKVKKPIFGTKKIFFHSKKIIGDDHDFGGHGHFGGGHGHFGGNTNIHKNTHIHINNRNANSVNNDHIGLQNRFEEPTNIPRNTQIQNRNGNPANNNHMGIKKPFEKPTDILRNTQIQNRNAANREERQLNGNEKIIGSHLFAAPRWRRDTLTRSKRSIVDLAKLVTDHRTRLDIQKTTENVGAATRNVFEEDYSPVFHLTNALGAAHDSMYSLMNDN